PERAHAAPVRGARGHRPSGSHPQRDRLMLRRSLSIVVAPALFVALQGCSSDSSGNDESPQTPTADLPEVVPKRLQALSPATLPEPPSDPTNAYAERADAAAFGQRLFFDAGFPGP